MRYDNEDDKRRFAVSMNWLNDKFPAKGELRDLPKSFLMDYFEALREYRIERIEWAAKRYFATTLYPRFPLAGELNKLANEAPASVCPALPVPERKYLEEFSGETIKTAKERFHDIIASLANNKNVRGPSSWGSEEIRERSLGNTKL